METKGGSWVSTEFDPFHKGSDRGNRALDDAFDCLLELTHADQR